MNEFEPCDVKNCAFRSWLTEGKYIAFWPLEFRDNTLETHPHMLWKTYIKFPPGNPRGHRTGFHSLTLCREHSDQVMHMFESEMAADVREQEMTEKYAIRKGGRIF